MNQLLNDRLQKKNVLRLSEISVSLFNMSNTVVPMPGIGDEADNGVVVGGFENHLTVLPTKTRPKRIILVIFSVLQYTTSAETTNHGNIYFVTKILLFIVSM